MVVASIALFVAAGGISWAAATIGTNDIQNKAVTAKKLDQHAVGKRKIKRHAVAGGKISGDQRTLWAAVALHRDHRRPVGRHRGRANGDRPLLARFRQEPVGSVLWFLRDEPREIVGAQLCNGGKHGIGKDCSPYDPNDSRHVRVVTMLNGALPPAQFTNLPFYVAALPK